MADSANGIKPFQRPRLTPEQQDQKLREAAKMYEQQFLQEMIKAMRGTVKESGLIKVGQSEKIFREQLDNNYAEQWAQRGGVGFADIIYKQLLENPRVGLKKPMAKPVGPLKLDVQSNFNGMVKANHTPAKSEFHFQFQPDIGPSALKEPDSLKVQAPWSGRLVGVKPLNFEEYLLELHHDNGLKSQLVFKGRPSVRNQIHLQAGDSIGELNQNATSLYWSVSPGSGKENNATTLE